MWQLSPERAAIPPGTSGRWQSARDPTHERMQVCGAPAQPQLCQPPPPPPVPASAAAHREASEEMGALPEYEVKGEIRTVRGKRGQKHYTVFVAEVSPAVRAAWSPALNREHSSFRWWPLGGARNAALHPVVERLFDPGQYLSQLQSIVPF